MAVYETRKNVGYWSNKEHWDPKGIPCLNWREKDESDSVIIRKGHIMNVDRETLKILGLKDDSELSILMPVEQIIYELDTKCYGTEAKIVKANITLDLRNMKSILENKICCDKFKEDYKAGKVYIDSIYKIPTDISMSNYKTPFLGFFKSKDKTPIQKCEYCEHQVHKI